MSKRQNINVIKRWKWKWKWRRKWKQNKLLNNDNSANAKSEKTSTNTKEATNKKNDKNKNILLEYMGDVDDKLFKKCSNNKNFNSFINNLIVQQMKKIKNK